jgi:putative nucleotidyltransferase with HDIG domain
LVAHLTLVHDVSCLLTAQLDATWPALRYDRAAVQIGAALHDIGKTAHPEELVQPGHAHEAAGEVVLREHGFPAALARFARTHRQWADELTPQPEDWLVALADTWWRGKREELLEAAVCHWIAEQTQTAQWEVFTALDDIATAITARADARLAWQRQFAPWAAGEERVRESDPSVP